MPASPAENRLILLGGAVIRSSGSPLGGPGAHRHRLALLALLAASPTPVSRDKLIAMLWPERDSEGGRNLLKVAVHELRKLLGDGAIRTTGDQLSVDVAVLSCDLIDVERAAESGDDVAVVAQYAGPLLDGFHLKDAPEFERWVDGQRSRVARLAAQSMEKLALKAEREGDWRAAVDWWRKLAAQDPPRADVALSLMRALDASGDRVGAIRHAEIHAAVRDREFGLEPDAAVTELARELMSRRTVRRPPAAERNEELLDDDVPFDVRPTGARGVGVWAGALAAAFLVGVGITAFIGTRREKPNVSSALAVSPFRVVGADSLAYLGAAMMEMLVVRFGNEGPLYAREARSPGNGGDAERVSLAIQQGRAAGAGKVLVGDVVAGGARGELDVSAVIYNVADTQVVGRASRTISGGSSIAATVDALAAELMSRAAGEPADRLSDLTRRPLPALRPYLAGQHAYRQGSYQRAESLFATALGVDSSFTLAGLGLALANSWTTINDHYGLGRDVALRGLADLSARDRLFVNAFFGSDPSIGEPKPAPFHLQAWEDVVHKHPDFAEAWYHVGDRYYHFGGLSGLADPLDQARTAFRRALTIDPGLVAPLHHLLEIHASRGEAAEAGIIAERYFQSNATVSRDASAIGWTAATVAADDRWLARVRRAFATMPLADLARIAWVTQANGWDHADADSALAMLERRASATFERSMAFRVQYAFALNAGQPARARAAGRALEGQLPDQPIAALWNVYAAMFGEADTAGVGRDVQVLAAFGSAPASGDADRRSRQVQARCLVGYSRVSEGSMASARDDLAAVRRRAATEPEHSVQRSEASMCATALAAMIAVETNASDAASLVALLDTMVLRDRIPPRISLAAAAVIAARLHERRGELKRALAATRWRENYTGDPTFLATQLRMEGDLALELDDTAAALHAYGRYLALRTNPEPGHASLLTESVRQRLSELARR